MKDDLSNSAREERQRLFVAVELPSSWLEAFRQHIEAVRGLLARSPETRDAHVRWVRPEGIHLTLQFLGEVPARRRRDIETALAVAVAAPPDLRLEMGRTGSFDRGAPRVLWVGVNGQTRELTALAGRVDAALAGAGFAPERRVFAPHLTLARLPDELPLACRQRIVQTAGQVELIACEPFVVQNIVLMRSHLGPGGARYEIVARQP